MQLWFRDLSEHDEATLEILVSVLTDYEIRRELLARGAMASLEQLDRITAAARYVQVTPEAARVAAELRARLRTDTRARFSDADLIMVVQAKLEHAALVTTDRWIHALPDIDARDWNALE